LKLGVNLGKGITETGRDDRTKKNLSSFSAHSYAPVPLTHIS